MTKQEFMQYMQQVGNVYNNSKINDEQIEVWFENLKFMSVERFNYILSEIYKTSKFMPTLADILQLHRQIPYTAKKEEVQVKSGKCNKCGNTGYVLYKKLIDNKPYTYSAVCDCGRANRYDGKEIADPKNKSEYYIPTITEIGLEIKSNMPSPEEVIKSMNELKNNPIISENIRNVIRNRFRELYRKWG